MQLRRLYLAVLSLILCLTTLIQSCSKKEPPEVVPTCGTTDGRTLVVYMASENSLSAYVSADVREILASTSQLGAKDHVILFVDNAASARIYDITRRDTARVMRDLVPAYTFPSQVNSCDPSCLKTVLDYARQRTAASSYYLIMWSHGSGWLPQQSRAVQSSPRFAFGYDNEQGGTANRGPQMDIKELAAVCQAFGGLDLLFFDACFMQNIETAYQLRNAARYIIGSPSEIPADGAPYNLILKPIFTDGDNLADILTTYHHGYNDNYVLLTAVRTDRLHAFADLTADYVARYRQSFLSTDIKGLLNYFDYDTYRTNGPYVDFLDIRGLMQRVLSPDDYATWYHAYQQLIVASVVSDYWMSMFSPWDGTFRVDKNQYGGMTMHVPFAKYDNNSPWFSRYFFTLDWAKKVWHEEQQP